MVDRTAAPQCQPLKLNFTCFWQSSRTLYSWKSSFLPAPALSVHCWLPACRAICIGCFLSLTSLHIASQHAGFLKSTYEPHFMVGSERTLKCLLNWTGNGTICNLLTLIFLNNKNIYILQKNDCVKTNCKAYHSKPNSSGSSFAKAASSLCLETQVCSGLAESARQTEGRMWSLGTMIWQELAFSESSIEIQNFFCLISACDSNQAFLFCKLMQKAKIINNLESGKIFHCLKNLGEKNHKILSLDSLSISFKVIHHFETTNDSVARTVTSMFTS